MTPLHFPKEKRKITAKIFRFSFPFFLPVLMSHIDPFREKDNRQKEEEKEEGGRGSRGRERERIDKAFQKVAVRNSPIFLSDC